MKWISTVIVMALGLMGPGCAAVKFYTDEELQNESGLVVYSVRPYLLVDAGGDDGNIPAVRIVYLPDRSQPRFMRIIPGFGGQSASLKLVHGMLAEYGTETESRFPDLMGNLEPLVEAAADWMRTIGEPLRREGSGVEIARINEMADRLKMIAGDLRALTQKPEMVDLLTRIQKETTLPGIADRLDEAADLLVRPGPADGDRRDQVRRILDDVRSTWVDIEVEPAYKTSREYVSFINRLETQLSQVYHSLFPDDSAFPDPGFYLFEIRMDAQGTRLIPVRVTW